MNRKTTLIAALLLSSACGAWATTSDGTPERTERMGEALSNYRSKVEANQNLGPASRTEAAIHRGASRTGEAISNGARKTGDAIGNGARKTGEAIEHGAKKTTEFVGNGLQRAGGAVERAGEKVEGSVQK